MRLIRLVLEPGNSVKLKIYAYYITANHIDGFLLLQFGEKVIVTTRGYESYRQAGMSDVQIKGMQRSDAARSDMLFLYKFK